MEEKQKNKLFNQSDIGKASRKSTAVFLIVLIFALVIIGYSTWNNARMEKYSRMNAQDYVSELTLQVAGTISTDQEDMKSMLSGMVSVLELTASDGITETGTNEYMLGYLNTAIDSSSFDFLIYLTNEGEQFTIGDLPENLPEKIDDTYAPIEEAEAAGGCVAYVEGDEILYVRMVNKGSERIGTLIGGICNERIQDLVNVQTYRDESNFCVTNREGKLLIASGDKRMTELKNVLEDGSEGMNILSQKLEGEIKAGNSGVVMITLQDNKTYYLAYAPVEGEDWMLLVLMPDDLFSGIYTKYMIRAFICSIASAVVFVILFSLLVIIYRKTRKRTEELAFVDFLTEGANNAQFQLNYTILQKRKKCVGYSIVLLDIKDFKLINEFGGFALGDRILKHVYRMISEELDPSRKEFAARVEMDHFFICLNEDTEAGIEARIDSIEQRINNESLREHIEFAVEFGAGACIVRDNMTDITTLEGYARVAKHSIKGESYGKCVIFNNEMQKRIFRDRRLDHMAEESMKNHDFMVYYQPKVSMSSGAVKGAEALVRWNHPERGLISPGEFLPVLEDSGRIQALDKYVFEEVCRWLHDRKQSGESLIPVSVNVSRLHFWKENFIKDYVEIADRYRIDRSIIEFEITETIFMEESKHAKIKDGIRQIHENGFRCSLDDFGVGYSSLSLISEMDVDTLKFDRSFFMDLTQEKQKKIVRCLLRMAAELELGVIIEGIETQEQIDFLKNEPCDVIQGYFYSRPLPEEEFERWLEARR